MKGTQETLESRFLARESKVEIQKACLSIRVLKAYEASVIFHEK